MSSKPQWGAAGGAPHLRARCCALASDRGKGFHQRIRQIGAASCRPKAQVETLDAIANVMSNILQWRILSRKEKAGRQLRWPHCSKQVSEHAQSGGPSRALTWLCPLPWDVSVRMQEPHTTTTITSGMLSVSPTT
eukprot:364779-Chlamydomonas_euryale.AAC.15